MSKKAKSYKPFTCDAPLPESLASMRLVNVDVKFDAPYYWEGIGYIRPNDEKISYFKKDIDAGNTDLLDAMLPYTKERVKWRYTEDKTGTEYCRSLYLVYKNPEHKSFLPTIDDRYVEGCCNVRYDVTIEVKFVCDEGFSRHLYLDYSTKGSYSMSPFSYIEDLEDILEEMQDKRSDGFKYNKEYDEMTFLFYNKDQSEQIAIHSIKELLSMVASIRVIKLDRTIIPIEEQELVCAE